MYKQRVLMNATIMTKKKLTMNNNRRLELCNFCSPENGKEIEDGNRKYRKDKRLYSKA